MNMHNVRGAVLTDDGVIQMALAILAKRAKCPEFTTSRDDMTQAANSARLALAASLYFLVGR